MKKSAPYTLFAVAAVAAVTAFLTFTSCGPNSNQIRRMQALEEGVSNPSTKEELEEAIKKYQSRVEDIINADIRVGVWYKLLGIRYLDTKMYGKALENFRLAAEFYPENQNLYYYIGLCAGFMSKSAFDYDLTGTERDRLRYLDLSESAYRRAIELEPRFVRALYGLSVLYVFERDEPSKAIPLLETVLDVEKKNTDGMMILARAYYSVGRAEDAVAMYDRVLETTKSDGKRQEAQDNKAFVLEQSYGQP